MAFARGNIETKGPLDQEELFKIAQVPDSLRVGTTIDIHSEVENLEKQQYSGFVYYSRTKNMFKAEDRLLQFPGVHNRQNTSSASTEKGYMFVFTAKQIPTSLTKRKPHTSSKTFPAKITAGSSTSRPQQVPAAGAANVTAEGIEILEPALQTSHQVRPTILSKHHPSDTTRMSTAQEMSAVASEDVMEISPPAPAIIIIPTASSKPSPLKKAAGSSSHTVPRGKLVKIGVVSQEHLIDLAKNPNNVRVGSTVVVKQRAVQYEEDGYSGEIFYTKAENMRKVEDKLLKHPGRYNVQRQSGAKERRGYIYVILGQKH